MAEELKIDNDKATKEMLEKEEYKYGFITEVEQDVLPIGLNEDVIKFISKKKNEPEWLLDYRLKAYKKWLTMKIASGILIPFMFWFIINFVSIFDSIHSQLIEFFSQTNA